MELLVVTLTQTKSEKEAETATRIRMIADTIRHASGLVNLRCYQGKGKENTYALLSTWEDEESWRKALEKTNPRNLLKSSAGEYLIGEPEQWFLHYLWGYTRPSAQQNIVTLQLANVRSNKIEQMQSRWLQSLSQKTNETPLAYGFTARGVKEDQIPTAKLAPNGKGGSSKEAPYLYGMVFVNLFSWGSERERETFYSNPPYQQASALLSSVSMSRIFNLEPC
jgi:quinol monooxygenase YgiN